MADPVAVARTWATFRFPYLASAILASPVVAAPGTGRVSVTRGWRLHVDPDVAAGLTVEELGTLLVHHAGHLLRDHARRGPAAGDPPAWLLATDLEIDDDLADAHLPVPRMHTLPADHGLPEHRLAEEYAVALGARPSIAQAPSDCGSGADGRSRPWDDDGDTPAIDEPTGELIRATVASEVIAASAAAPGSVPAGWERWARAVRDPVVDWRRVLAGEVRRGLERVAGRVDYSYRRPSRRAAVVTDVVLASLHQPAPEVAVVVDTSASMSATLLGDALAEVDGVLRAVGVGRRNVRVLAVDAGAAAAAQRVAQASDVRLIGGGGTDMARGIAEAAALRPPPGLVVVITDGRTPWPDGPPPGVDVVVALVGDDPPLAPVWAREVRVVPGVS